MKRLELEPFWYCYTTKSPTIFADSAQFIVTDHMAVAWVLFRDGTRRRCKRRWAKIDCDTKVRNQRWVRVPVAQDFMHAYTLRVENSPTSG